MMQVALITRPVVWSWAKWIVWKVGVSCRNKNKNVSSSAQQGVTLSWIRVVPEEQVKRSGRRYYEI